MSDAWKAPDESAAATAAGKLDLATGPKTRNPMDVPTKMFEAFKANIAGWFLAGFAQFGAILAVVFVAVAAMGLGVIPGVVMEDETLLMVGALVGMLVYIVAIFTFSLLVAPLMSAAMIRGLDAERRGEGNIGLTTPFAGITTDAGRVVIFNLIGQAMILCGMLMLYVPGLVAAAVVTFALPIVVLEPETSPMEALGRSWKAITNDPVWHLAQVAVLFAAVIVAELTVVGIFVMMPLLAAHQVYAYREMHASPAL